MKTILIVILAVACSAATTHAADPATNNTTLVCLSSSFTNRTYQIGTNHYVVALMWISKIHATNCQRPLNLYLKSNEIGGFINPTNLKPFPMADREPLFKAVLGVVSKYLTIASPADPSGGISRHPFSGAAR
jgi:hypothetical protein